MLKHLGIGFMLGVFLLGPWIAMLVMLFSKVCN
jgi:hypothetical protein